MTRVLSVVLMVLAAWSAGAAGAETAAEVGKSPTLGKKPPADAVVLVAMEAGKAPSLDKWTNKTWEASAEGYIVKGKGDQRTEMKLGDMQLHLEFNIPPGEGGKKAAGGGNSGLYIMDRYEVQILDSHGDAVQDSSCGAIYRKIPPKVNAALPAGQWQTYDITFRAPRFDAQGAKTDPVRITVVLNGVTVHDNVEVPGPTGAASGKKEVAEDPLRLQDHGCPVKFRNVWVVVPKK